MSSGFAWLPTLDDSSFIRLRDVLGPRLSMGFPGGARGEGPACQCRQMEDTWVRSWVRKSSWRRACQPTPVFWPGESHGQRSLTGLQSMGSQRVGHGRSNLAHKAFCTQAMKTRLESSRWCTSPSDDDAAGDQARPTWQPPLPRAPHWCEEGASSCPPARPGWVTWACVPLPPAETSLSRPVRPLRSDR